MEKKATQWYCVSCPKVLGEVLGGEFFPDDSISGKLIQTRGPNLVVTCPDCSSKKVWYTADPIVRAMYQLVDAIVTVSANRMVFVVGKRLNEMMAEKKDFDENK